MFKGFNFYDWETLCLTQCNLYISHLSMRMKILECVRNSAQPQPNLNHNGRNNTENKD